MLKSNGMLTFINVIWAAAEVTRMEIANRVLCDRVECAGFARGRFVLIVVT